jgi:NitT/TauT family transport system ATP-binding protein
MIETAHQKPRVSGAQAQTLATDGRPAAISVRDVVQRYAARGNASAVLALDHISLDVRQGEFLCLLGPSGCGKSTLLNVIGGLVRPSGGAVQVSGTEMRGPLPAKVSFVFQESTLFPWYTVTENFAVGFKYQNVPRREWRARTMDALASVGMAQFAEHYPNQLSVGMRQRINMARGIAAETEILLMDEPFAALDEQSRMVLGEDLSILLAKTGKTIVFVTHSLSEAVFLSDRIVLMTARPGRIKDIIMVDVPHPRSPDFMLEPRFSELRNACYASLRDEIRRAMATSQDQGA